MTHVIESDDYRDEQARLMEDPLIRDMAEGIRRMSLSDEELDSWAFMSSASDEYNRRGGQADSIGGPARAIKALLKSS